MAGQHRKYLWGWGGNSMDIHDPRHRCTAGTSAQDWKEYLLSLTHFVISDYLSRGSLEGPKSCWKSAHAAKPLRGFQKSSLWENRPGQTMAQAPASTAWVDTASASVLGREATQSPTQGLAKEHPLWAVLGSAVTCQFLGLQIRGCQLRGKFVPSESPNSWEKPNCVRVGACVFLPPSCGRRKNAAHTNNTVQEACGD